MFKQTLSVSFLGLGTITFPATSLAITVQEVPNPRQVNCGWVSDQANMLSPETEVKLNQIICDLEAKNGSEIAIVTVPETAPAATPKEFATELFNYWKIGKAGEDNGVLFLISKGDRRVEIETGYGVEGILPDIRVGNIIQQNITPRFKKDDFNGGTLAGTKALVVALKAYKSTPNVGTTNAATPNSGTANAPILNPGTNQPNLDTNETSPLIGWLTAIVTGTTTLVGIVYAYRRSRRPLFIEPEGRSQLYNSWWRRPLYCAYCQKPLEKLDSSLVHPHLSKPEQVAQNIGSVSFEGWQCPNCRPHLTGLGIHICAYVSSSSSFSKCLKCQELTVIRTSKVLRHAMQYQEGIRLITYNCHCCSYHQEKQERIPRLPPPPPPPPPSSGSGGSCSGGSFGGGSSGGGGAGGSY